MYTANMPATAAVERNVAVRMKSGSTTDDPHTAYIVHHRRLIRQVHLVSQPMDTPTCWQLLQSSETSLDG
jgi:hypothetical protein